MVQSQNKIIDLTIKGISYLGINTYGDIMVGDKAFEFYNEHNLKDYIQIPWDEIDYIAGSVVGRKISRFVIFTKSNGHYSFSSRDNKLLLRTVNKYIPSEKLVKSDTFFKVIKRGVGSIFKRKE